MNSSHLVNQLCTKLSSRCLTQKLKQKYYQAWMVDKTSYPSFTGRINNMLLVYPEKVASTLVLKPSSRLILMLPFISYTLPHNFTNILNNLNTDRQFIIPPLFNLFHVFKNENIVPFHQVKWIEMCKDQEHVCETYTQSDVSNLLLVCNEHILSAVDRTISTLISMIYTRFAGKMEMNDIEGRGRVQPLLAFLVIQKNSWCRTDKKNRKDNRRKNRNNRRIGIRDLNE